MARKTRATTPKLGDVDLDDLLSIPEAARAARVSVITIRRAIRSGELKAMIPLGKDPTRIGRGPGYRIHKRELHRWFMGDAAVPNR